MTSNELQNILQSDNKLTLQEVKEIIKELQKTHKEKYIAPRNNQRVASWCIINTCQICLDLLGKVEE